MTMFRFCTTKGKNLISNSLDFNEMDVFMFSEMFNIFVQSGDSQVDLSFISMDGS